MWISDLEPFGTPPHLRHRLRRLRWRLSADMPVLIGLRPETYLDVARKPSAGEQPTGHDRRGDPFKAFRHRTPSCSRMPLSDTGRTRCSRLPSSGGAATGSKLIFHLEQSRGLPCRGTLPNHSWNFPHSSKSFGGERCGNQKCILTPIWSMEKQKGII